MKKGIQAVFLAFLCITAMPIIADTFTPSNSCSQPRKPYQFDDDWEIERFKRDVESYQRCISDFVDEQNEAVRKHQDAAEEAIDEWNNFVNYELR